MTLEICLDGAPTSRRLARDLRAIRAGGARRIELCREAAVGGLSPTPAAIRQARRLLDPAIELLVLVRPRPGDFVYDARELAAMGREIGQAADLGAQGVVLGALRPGSQGPVIHRRALETWVRLCRRRGLSLTFHRAFDELARPEQGLEQLIRAGVQRVLSAGRPGGYGEPGCLPPSVPPDERRLCRLLEQARGRIELVAGGGLDKDSAHTLAGGLARFGGAFSLHSRGAVLAGGHVSRKRVASLAHGRS